VLTARCSSRGSVLSARNFAVSKALQVKETTKNLGVRAPRGSHRTAVCRDQPDEKKQKDAETRDSVKRTRSVKRPKGAGLKQAGKDREDPQKSPGTGVV